MITRLFRRGVGAYLLLLTVSSGAFGLLVPVRAEDVIYAFPRWAQLIWFAGLLFGGGTALSGIIMGRVRGLYIERAGCAVLFFVSSAVAIGAAGQAQPGQGWYGVAAVGVYALFCAGRVLTIGGEARERATLELVGR